MTIKELKAELDKYDENLVVDICYEDPDLGDLEREASEVKLNVYKPYRSDDYYYVTIK